MWTIPMMAAAWSAAALVSAPPPAGRQGPAPVCPERWGQPGAPLVSRPETAKAVFLAVEQDLLPAAVRRDPAGVSVEDEGDAWSVFRHGVESGPRAASTPGGGGLSLRIAKCDGALSEVWLGR